MQLGNETLIVKLCLIVPTDVRLVGVLENILRARGAALAWAPLPKNSDIAT